MTETKTIVQQLVKQTVKAFCVHSALIQYLLFQYFIALLTLAGLTAFCELLFCYLVTASLLQALNKQQEALIHFREAVKLAPGHFEAQKGSLLVGPYIHLCHIKMTTCLSCFHSTFETSSEASCNCSGKQDAPLLSRKLNPPRRGPMC